MELISVLRMLASRRWLVAVGFVIAVAVGLVVSYSVTLGVPPKFHSRQYYVGEASAQVLIDTPNSQVTDLAAAAVAPALYQRATLLADLMASAPAEQAIASQVGIALNQLAVTPPPSSVVIPIKASPLALAGTRTAAANTHWELSVTVDPTLPVIAFTANAPSPQHAKALASAAITVLRERMSAVDATGRVRAGQQTVVNVIGPPLATSVARGPRKLFGLAATLVVFLLICFGIVLRAAGVRRRAADRETDVGWQPDDLSDLDLDPEFFSEPERFIGFEPERTRAGAPE